MVHTLLINLWPLEIGSESDCCLTDLHFYSDSHCILPATWKSDGLMLWWVRLSILESLSYTAIESINRQADCKLTAHSIFDLILTHTPPLWTDLVKISSRKTRHASSFSLECTDFKNVIFEKIHWAHSEDAEVAEVKRPRNPKWRKF